ncbi:MAG: hypothetical protein PF447_08825 [Spirochaetaceae bacterium]|jgi:hypothetical protein|nr:hypothetical protein [Spirochaetaceae bacterium]
MIPSEQEIQQIGLDHEMEEPPPEIHGSEPLSLPEGGHDDLWKKLMKSLREMGKIHLLSLLDRCDKNNLSEDCLYLTFSKAYDAHSVEEEERGLAALLKELSGRNYRVEYKILKVEKNPEEERPLNDQVEMIRQIFQGHIVKKGGK